MELLTTNIILSADTPIDLQMHTTNSDGTWTPEQLIDYLVSEQFGLVAVTDHDRVDTIVPLQQLAAHKRLPVLAAVEMSTSWNGEATDVLCYGIDLEKHELHKLLEDVLHRQHENTKEVYENLQRKGYTFPDPQELTTLLEQSSSYQMLGLMALLEKHGYGTGRTVLEKMIFDAGFVWATNDITAVIDAAHRSGAVCLIAHPGRGGYFTEYDPSLLDQLRKEVPIDGFEAHYPAHTPGQTAMYLEYAEKHGLLVSSGSDSHDPEHKPIKYRAELSRRLLERVGIQIT